MTCYLTEGKVQEIVNLHYLKENLFNGTYSMSFTCLVRCISSTQETVLG